MPKSWPELQSLIIEKAMRDDEYRRRLLEDARRVVEEEIGEALPEGAKIEVIEATAETGYLVLPPRLPIQGELPDEALEDVSGGAYVATKTTQPAYCSFYGGFGQITASCMSMVASGCGGGGGGVTYTCQKK